MENPKIEQARHLYFAQAKTQKEIAHILDVSEKTIYNWIKRHSWDQMRQAARQAPALISENLCSHLVELQNSIARREPGCRYPTKEESQIINNLVAAIGKMKKFPGLSMNMQVMATFQNWMRTRDKDFTRDLSVYSNLFLEGYAKNGYYPYELEFGLDKISPIDPFYEEEPIDEQPEPTTPSLPKDVAKNENQQPENLPSKPQQSIDIQDSYSNADTFPPPVKTGNNPATPDRSDDYPWRKWLPDHYIQAADDLKNNSNRRPRKE